jgi:PAS domain S-box-containing protein
MALAEHLSALYLGSEVGEAVRMSEASSRAMAHLKAGDHLCCLYEPGEGRRALVTALMRQGLEQGEKVIYVAEARSVDTILGHLREDGLAVEPYLECGQLAVLSHSEVCPQDGASGPERLMAVLRSELDRSLAQGYSALRFTAEMSWGLRAPSDGKWLMEYESGLDRFLPGSRCVAICQYNMHRFDPAILLEMLRTHPLVAVGTDVYDNFYYVPPADLVTGDPPAAELRRRLQNLAVRRQGEEGLRGCRERLQRVISTFPSSRDPTQVHAESDGAAEAPAGVQDWALDPVTRQWLPDLLQAIVSCAVGLLSARGGGIYLYRLATDDLELRYRLELGHRKEVLSRGEGLCGNVLATGRPMTLADLRQLEDVSAQCAEPESACAVAAPIISAGQIQGVLYLTDEHSRFLSRADVALLERFTPLAAAALEQRRLLEEQWAQWHEVETLRQASAAVTEIPGLDERLERILEQLQRVVPYDSASVQLLRDDHLEIVGGRGFAEPEAIIGLMSPVAAGTPNLAVIEDRHPVLLRGAPAINLGFSQPAHDHVRCWLGVPLIVSDHVIGMLTVHAFDENHFDETHAGLVFPFAHQAAVAIENARLYEEARRYAAELETLQRTSLELTSSLDPSAVLDTIADSALSLVGASNCHIYLYNETTETLTFGTALWEDGRREPACERPRSDGLTATVARQGQAMVINDAVHHHLYATPEAQEWGVEAIVGFPLKRAERVLGVGTIAFLKPHVFIEDEVRILGLLADQAAIAIDNARLFQETEQLRAFNESIVQSVAEAILMEDADGSVTFSNRTAQELLGYTQKELSRLHWSAIVPETEKGRIGEELTKRPAGIMSRYETVLLSKEGRRVPVIVSARPLFADGRFVGVLSAFTDITERKRMEERVRGQERLAAVGQLAAGIAHDFNNILTSMIGFAQLVGMRADVPESARADVGQIVEGGQRAANLIGQILDFSRKSLISPQPLDLVPLLQETVRFLQRTIPESIRVVLEMAAEEYWVQADPTQIRRALTNLAVNARDAMASPSIVGSPSGGELRFRLSHLTLRPEDARPFASMAPGDWITLSVSDTGSGIPSKVVPHIYEPFFTTKKPGEGTGLGLAQVYGIVKQHDGFIDVATQVDRGTTFTMYLPPLAERQQPARDTAQEALGRGCGEIILVVEDEPQVLGVCKAMLEHLGYVVVTASTGLQALDVYKRQGSEIALVLADVVMPQMGGTELCQALWAWDSKVKMVVMTGYPLEEEGQQLLERGIVDWILKPLDLSRLAQVVGDALA